MSTTAIDPTGAPGPRYLTKSEFIAGLQCHKRLWWTVHEPACQELVPDRNALALMHAGRLVGATARDYVPDGVLIGPAYQGAAARAEATARAMRDGASVIYEATFVADGMTVSTDILRRTDDGWTLMEVKAALEVKAEHIVDVAFQANLLRHTGVPLRRVEVMHLNRECRHPNLEHLFTSADVTEPAAALAGELAAAARAQLAVLAEPTPRREIGPHCQEPIGCPFRDRCWPEFPEHHVSTVYYAGKQWWEWERQGWRTIHDLPDHVKLRAPARRQVRAVREDRMIVEDGLRSALEGFDGPLAFLDFETVRLPIPAWPGCAPLMHVPVQFSCHLDEENGGRRHIGWLADGPEDPRPELARQLVAACASARAVVAYFARFERDCLEHLAAAVPALERDLLAIADRLVDLLPVVRDHVYHPGFRGGFGLKKVHPALVPTSVYGTMEIAEGETASNELTRLLFHRDAMAPQERHLLREQLEEYCRQDTWAMVQLLDHLRALA